MAYHRSKVSPLNQRVNRGTLLKPNWLSVGPSLASDSLVSAGGSPVADTLAWRVADLPEAMTAQVPEDARLFAHGVYNAQVLAHAKDPIAATVAHLKRVGALQ